ncbi:MAG: RNA polymerase sigma factor [Firmicutes bacterium]|nr:RNA polymerase sigma factor [Bacillota bacterium]
MPLSTNDGSLSARDVDECIYAVGREEDDALRKLYDLVGSSVYAYALSVTKNVYDAQDVLHDTFIKVYESAHNYVSQGKPMAWLLTIAKNLCYTKFRQQSKFADVSDEDLEKQFGCDSGEAVESKLVVMQMLSALNESERTIVVLHAMSGLKHKDIAKLLEIPLATVLSKYNRALKKLQRIFKEKDGE